MSFGKEILVPFPAGCTLSMSLLTKHQIQCCVLCSSASALSLRGWRPIQDQPSYLKGLQHLSGSFKLGQHNMLGQKQKVGESNHSNAWTSRRQAMCLCPVSHLTDFKKIMSHTIPDHEHDK